MYKLPRFPTASGRYELLLTGRSETIRFTELLSLEKVSNGRFSFELRVI
jgi:hypothetical protein